MEKELKEWHNLHIFYASYDYQTKDLAMYLKVSPRTIQRWVEGQSTPSSKKLKLIKEYLSNKQRR